MAERLMDALDAGQSKGGDTRGMQSAGILVVRPLQPKSDPPSNASSTSVWTMRRSRSSNCGGCST